jgi:Zn-dependent protease/CBS domain-containing protein
MIIDGNVRPPVAQSGGYMNRQSITIGRIFGIPVGIDYSWFLIFALVTWSLATSYFPTEFKNWSPATYWLVGGLTSILFFGSVLVHELAHSVVAERFKIPVKKITLYIFGGISEMKIEPPTAWSEFWITIVGPGANLVLAGIFALLGLAFSAYAPAQALFKYEAYINLVLGLFNLIPGYPLDGGSVLMAIIWGITHKRHWGIVVASIVGSLLANLLIVLGVFQAFSGNIWNGLWIAFIGWFMLNASGGAIRQERLKGFLSGHHVSEAMSKFFTIIYPDTTLQWLVDEHILGGSRRSFIVKKDDQLVGMLTMHVLQTIPKSEWGTKTVGEVMIPVGQMKTISPTTELFEAIQEMDRDGVNQLPVMEAGEVQGMLTREDVISYLRRLQSSNLRPRPVS